MPAAIGLTNKRTALAVLPAGPTRAEETRFNAPTLYRRLPTSVVPTPGASACFRGG